MNKPYKDFRKVECWIAGRPDVLKMVDPVRGIVYINTGAQADANIVYLMTTYSRGIFGQV